MPNTGGGVNLAGNAASNTIGGTALGAENLISGNAGFGIQLTENATLNRIEGNEIGIDAAGTGPLENTGPGVFVTNGAVNNTIGGDPTTEANMIAYNQDQGVLLDPTAGIRNQIVGNAIYENGRMGIDLNGDDVTPNDGDDVDGGPNDLLNFPEITSATALGGTIDIDFDLDVPSGFYRIEFFRNPSGVDSTGYGEGESLADAVILQDTGPGVYSYSHSFAGVVGDTLTATCTECMDGVACTVFGSTSEFSAAVGVTAPQPLAIVKRAFLPDSTTVPDGATLAKGTTVHYLLYVNNDGPARADASLRDILDAAFDYQLQSIRVDNSLANCAAGNCTALEEEAIFEAVVGQATGTDEIDADVVSYTAGSRAIDAGDGAVGNAQLDVAANSVWALLFTVEVQ